MEQSPREAWFHSLARNSLHFTESMYSLPCSQEPTNTPYPVSDESTLHFNPVH